METQTYQLIVLKNGAPSSLSLDELRVLLGQPTTPVPDTDTTTPPGKVEEAKLFGEPRRWVGNKVDGGKTYRVFTSPNVPGVIVQFSASPDTIAIKGADWDYTPLSGMTKPGGVKSDWYGNAEPKGTLQPEGYEKRYFDAEKKQPYYVYTGIVNQDKPACADYRTKLAGYPRKP